MASIKLPGALVKFQIETLHLATYAMTRLLSAQPSHGPIYLLVSLLAATSNQWSTWLLIKITMEIMCVRAVRKIKKCYPPNQRIYQRPLGKYLRLRTKLKVVRKLAYKSTRLLLEEKRIVEKVKKFRPTNLLTLLSLRPPYPVSSFLHKMSMNNLAIATPLSSHLQVNAILLAPPLTSHLEMINHQISRHCHLTTLSSLKLPRTPRTTHPP